MTKNNDCSALKRVESKWVMVDVETKEVWYSTIESRKKTCMATAAEYLALDCVMLDETNLKPVKCTVTIEIKGYDLKSVCAKHRPSTPSYPND